MNPSDDIKAKLDIVEVIREYIPLKPAGVNFRAPCPFHKEKTPSFIVSPDKQIWHCFGCGKGGDIFTFIMEMENLEFVEALRSLALKAGVTLKKSDPKLTSQRNRILDILDLAKKFYRNALAASSEANGAREYLKRRGLTEETIAEWEIGFSPDSWDKLSNWLKIKKFGENEIFLAGLSVRREDRPGFYDRFRGRIMFPINDPSGTTVAFSARVSPEKEATEKMGKYINSPQTMVYDKSRIIFGLDKAKQSIKTMDAAVLVEGQMDCITAHQHNFKNVVASSGTALTADQIKLVKRYSQNLYLSFDMDEAGDTAAARGAREALRAEMNIKVVKLPAGKDPDELIRKDAAAWPLAISEAKPVMKYFFSRATEGRDTAMAEDKREIAKLLLPIIAGLGSTIERDHWLKELSSLIDINEAVLRETLAGLLRKLAGQAEEPCRPELSAADRGSREEKMSEMLLALLLKFPSLCAYAADNLSVYHLVGEDNQRLYKNILLFYNNSDKEHRDESDNTRENDLAYLFLFKKWLESQPDKANASTVKSIDRLSMLGDRDYFEYDLEKARRETINAAIFLKKHFLYMQMKDMERLIAEAEKEKDTVKVKELAKEFKNIVEEFRELGK